MQDPDAEYRLLTCDGGIGGKPILRKLQLVVVLAIGRRGNVEVGVLEVLGYWDGVGPPTAGIPRHSPWKRTSGHRGGGEV
jgi:hypothetical protein